MAARQDTTKALSRSERGSAQHSHTSCGFESLAWGRSPRADSASAMATLQSESRELRLQHREQFLDVLVRVPHMRGHAHGPTAHGDVDVGRGKALRQIGRHAAAEAQSEIVTRTAVGRHAGDAQLGARPRSVSKMRGTVHSEISLSEASATGISAKLLRSPTSKRRAPG